MNTILLGESHLQIFTPEQTKLLMENGDLHGVDHTPVVHIWTDAGLECLITEWNEEDNTAYGLYKRKNSAPEIGYLNMSVLENFIDEGRTVWNNPGFTAKYPLSVFAAVAKEMELIPNNQNLFSDQLHKANILLHGA